MIPLSALDFLEVTDAVFQPLLLMLILRQLDIGLVQFLLQFLA